MIVSHSWELIYFDASYSAKDLRINRVGAAFWATRDGSKYNEWVRIHVNSRTAMFTPYEVAFGPKRGEAVGNVRIIVDNFMDGNEFLQMEEWKHLADAHDRTDRHWIGATIFAEM